MLGLSRRLMQLMALSLDLPEDHFDADSESPMVTLRMVRYPPQPADADDRTFGAGAHTDWGALTLLAQDGHGGLEVCMPDGGWVPATPMEGCLVVNLGDMVPRRSPPSPRDSAMHPPGPRPHYFLKLAAIRWFR